MAAEPTPLMRQYEELKLQAGNALLLFRMGDFYELFGPDAILASQLLGITLTSRDRDKENGMPMAGVPHHSVEGYIQKLLQAGHKVAIAEQLSELAEGAGGKAIVKREIVREFTPAIQFNWDLDGKGAESAWLAVSIPDFQKKGYEYLCAFDPSTGETFISGRLPEESLPLFATPFPIRHWIQHPDANPETSKQLMARSGCLREDFIKSTLPHDQADRLLRENFGISAIETFAESPEERLGLAILIRATMRAQRLERLIHLKLPRPLRDKDAVIYGPHTWEHLDLLELFNLINTTHSAMGARTLRSWLKAPLKSVTEISKRQEAIGALTKSPALDFKDIYDLERIFGRIHTKLASPRDTRALGRSLQSAKLILKNLASIPHSLARDTWLDARKRTLEAGFESLGNLPEHIVQIQKDDAPLLSRDGGIFNRGVSEDLDRLIDLTEKGERWLIELEERERNSTGIHSLKVRYNRVFGYFIEITHAHLAKVPAHYQRKQTMVGAERFFTEELKKFEEEILTAGSKRRELEAIMFTQLLERIAAHSAAVSSIAQSLAELDAISALSRLCERPAWSMPTIDASLEFRAESARHPVVEQALGGRFVANDIYLGQAEPILVVTGPNMGGKSTIMRETALIVILGQMGAPVPAKCAHWGSFSSVFTRIGAHDAISKGQSTFMVEMSELAHMLHHADQRSLLVLDEIGRGTSTYDGISVAWSTLEWIAERLKSRTLFATHYHELTKGLSQVPGIRNAHLAVETHGHDLRFLYELRNGATSDSFGIAVARLAGLPSPLIERAWDVLSRLEGKRQAPVLAEMMPASQNESEQLSFLN